MGDECVCCCVVCDDQFGGDDMIGQCYIEQVVVFVLEVMFVVCYVFVVEWYEDSDVLGDDQCVVGEVGVGCVGQCFV